MTDAGFVIAGYGVILGGVVVYVAFLVRRLRAAHEALRRTARSTPPDARR